MTRMLPSSPAIARLRPKPMRQEIFDKGCRGLVLVVQPSGAKSWAFRYRRPGGRAAKLTFGTCDCSGEERKDDPVIGGHLTLAAAHRLASWARHQLSLKLDPAEAKQAADTAQASAFGRAVR